MCRYIIINKIILKFRTEPQVRNRIIKAVQFIKIRHFQNHTLNKEDRSIGGLIYLNKKYTNYFHLIEQSNLLRKRMKKDELEELTNIRQYFSDTESSNSLESNKQNITDI